MKNYAYKLVGELGVRVLSTVFLLILARIVGAAEFGVYSSAFAFASIFAILVDLGTNPIITREIARYPEKRSQIVASVNALKAVTGVLMLLCLGCITHVIDFPWEKARLLHWFGWVVVGTAFTEYLSAIFTGLEQMGMEAILKIIGKGVVILAAMITLAATREVYPTVKVMGVFSIVSIGVGAWMVRWRLGTFGFRPDKVYLRSLLKRSLPLFGALAFLILYGSQGILILNYFRIADHDIGFFALATKIIDVLKVLPVLLASAFLPSLSRHAQISKPLFQKRALELMRYAALGFPVLTAIVYIAAPGLLQLLYGQSYQDAVPALRLLLIGFLFMAFNLILLHFLIALDKEKEALIGSGTVCLTHLAVSAALVPRYGMIGTCYALIVSELTALCVQTAFVKSAVVSGPQLIRPQEVQWPR